MNKIIIVKSNDIKILYKLNDSKAAYSLYQQLPLKVKVENYSNDEKIFYLQKLNVTNTPKANARLGTLAYYEPWGNIVMFYKNFGMAAGLYELGEVIEGKDNIQKLTGEIKIEAIN